MRYWLLALMLLTSTLAHSTIREYWIAADEVYWDYAPSFPINRMTGEAFTEDQRVFVEDFVGGVYLKALYREYAPGFEEVKPRGPRGQHLGTLGPILRAEVGDTILSCISATTRAFRQAYTPMGSRCCTTATGWMLPRCCLPLLRPST